MVKHISSNDFSFDFLVIHDDDGFKEVVVELKYAEFKGVGLLPAIKVLCPDLNIVSVYHCFCDESELIYDDILEKYYMNGEKVRLSYTHKGKQISENCFIGRMQTEMIQPYVKLPKRGSEYGSVLMFDGTLEIKIIGG